mgnify:CR=1 FL=1
MEELIVCCTAGILARDIPSDVADLQAQQIAPITVVVCNLYPFNETVAKIPEIGRAHV